MVKEVGVTGDVLYYYRVPARDLYHGLRKLIKDDDCLEMATWVQLSKTIEVYVQRATMSEDEELEEFVDSECDESEDDRFFDSNVDKEVEWGGLSYGKGKAPLESKQTGDNDVSDQEAQSDELVSLYGSSDEEGGPPKDRFSQFNMATDIADPKFKVGMIFPTRRQFKLAVKEHAIKTRKPIMLVKNDKQRVRVICKDKKCVKWVLLASKMQGSESFQVKKYVPTHTCKRVFYNKHVTTRWLSRKYVETLRSNPTWPVKSFKDQVQQDLKVGVSRAQLYKAKTLALQMIEGSHVQQYDILWLCTQLKSNDRSGTPQRSSQAPHSSSQPTVATPTRRSQRQAQQSSSQPPPTTRSSLGGSRGRKKGAQSGGRK
ncbi:hypothetical protein Vadar_022543 [Vaccinium darrowii]|uniref:Uncharacterized protein n=1 Tax=Vaccinium darrowii TaxID=229202 RepID=A0ACB7Y0T9_9ERIC|nr:hypothetical protein Vadar_022543 [Vaccinium darrowii]